nr:MAG TPA: hypothetical protein [Caudoviricetes sp.]
MSVIFTEFLFVPSVTFAKLATDHYIYSVSYNGDQEFLLDSHVSFLDYCVSADYIFLGVITFRPRW